MKYLLSICLIWLNVILISCILMAGCTQRLTLQPEIHPTAGTSVMFIPKGCKIGGIEAPENGIYIGESKLIESMIREREEENKRKRQGCT